MLLPFLLTVEVLVNSSKVGLEEPDPTFFHHVRKSRMHANRNIITKLKEQVRKPTTKIKMTKSAIKNCKFDKEELG